jgi:Fe-S-cluster containining protein
LSDQDAQPADWFDPADPRNGDAGLRFSCTMCGNCCTGPEGYVLVTEDDTAAIAAAMNLPHAAFIERYTHMTTRGRSLNEHLTDFGQDCVFLDRAKVPGKAVCGIYELRPAQCRTWPFWKSNLMSLNAWERATRKCPGMDKGTLVPVEQIRIQRSRIEM